TLVATEREKDGGDGEAEDVRSSRASGCSFLPHRWCGSFPSSFRKAHVGFLSIVQASPSACFKRCGCRYDWQKARVTILALQLHAYSPDPSISFSLGEALTRV
ncbi:hypothetical protein O6P43_017803, partial [Quillaja saponaria]